MTVVHAPYFYVVTALYHRLLYPAFASAVAALAQGAAGEFWAGKRRGSYQCLEHVSGALKLHVSSCFGALHFLHVVEVLTCLTNADLLINVAQWWEHRLCFVFARL